MSCFIRQLTPDGLLPVDYGAESLAGAAVFEPPGVYTITRTYPNRQALKLDAHLDRLVDSAHREGITLALDRPRLRSALRQLIAESGYDVVRFRVTVPHDAPDRPILSAEPFVPPDPATYRVGIRCVTVTDQQRHNPLAKTTGWMSVRRAVQAAFPPGVSEGLLVSPDGEMLEGLTSNFYAIVDGHLQTAGSGVLPGIAQQVVLSVAPAIIPVVVEPTHTLDIPRFDEAFITSASRGIVPVVEIDGVRIGDGAPGPYTRALSGAYLAWVGANLEDI